MIRIHALLLLLVGLLAACGRSMCDISEEATSDPAKNQAEVVPIGVQILDFGPRNARAGVPFNQQPDGASALWFKLDRNVEGSVVNVHVGDQLITGDISGDIVTVKIPDELHDKPGTVNLSLDQVNGGFVVKSGIVNLILEKP